MFRVLFLKGLDHFRAAYRAVFRQPILLKYDQVAKMRRQLPRRRLTLLGGLCCDNYTSGENL